MRYIYASDSNQDHTYRSEKGEVRREKGEVRREKGEVVKAIISIIFQIRINAVNPAFNLQ